MRKRPYIPVLPGHIKDADDSRTDLLKALGLTDIKPMNIGDYNNGYNDPPVAAVKIDGQQYSLNTILKRVGDKLMNGASAADLQKLQSAVEDLQGDAEDLQRGVEKLEDLLGDLTQRSATRYGTRWDKTNAQCVRTGAATLFGTDTSNYGHFGAVNSDYANPFDGLYPWSGIRLCNIDLAKYQALKAGDSLVDCVVAWEGDSNFSYDHANGVWRYRPELWGLAWDSGDFRYFDVADQPLTGYTYYPEAVEGRWHGRIVTLEGKTVLLPLPGMPGKRVAVNTLHNYAKNFGGTIDTIHSIDADALLYLVEYAGTNIQSKLGNGVSALYRQNASDTIQAASTGATVKVLKANAALCIPGAIFDIGTSNGGAEVGSFIIASVADDTNSTLLNVTLAGNDGVTPANVTVTTENIWSIHGKANTKDEAIGSMSGYIGVNGQSIAYYRGKEMYANLWFYVLGAYRQTGTRHIWVAKDENDAINYNALNTNVHIDTGITLPVASGYVGAMGIAPELGLNFPPFATETGGTSENPVGDYVYMPAETTGNTILLVGGSASTGGLRCGFSGAWDASSGNSLWRYAARPRLKTPLGG